MVVIVQAHRLAWFWLFFFGIPPLCLIAALCLGRVPRVTSIAPMSGAFLAMISCIRTLFFKQRNSAVIGPAGILLFDASDHAQSFPRDQVARAEYVRFGGGARLVSTGGRALGFVDFEFLGSTKRVRQFIAAVNSYPRATAEQAASPAE